MGQCVLKEAQWGYREMTLSKVPCVPWPWPLSVHSACCTSSFVTSAKALNTL